MTTSQAMHHLYADDECEQVLIDELRRAFPEGEHMQVLPNWIQTNADLASPLAFCRQALPNSQRLDLPSINAWADALVTAAIGALPPDQPWRLQLCPCYGFANAGLNRCELIAKAFRERLQKRRKSLLRTLVESEAPFQPNESLVQLYLSAPDQGFVSVCAAPQLHEYRRNVWPFAKGELPVAVDKAAPSRAFSKLVEAEQRMGAKIARNETCVDLGASPGSWSYVAVHRGAQVTSVDRSPLRDDLMKHPRLRFVQGDAFKFVPEKPVDWLVCDVIAAPERSIALLTEWLREKRARKFIVSIKFHGTEGYALLDGLKKTLPDFCTEFFITRLCANKNEACAFGIV